MRSQRVVLDQQKQWFPTTHNTHITHDALVHTVCTINVVHVYIVNNYYTSHMAQAEWYKENGLPL